MNRQRKQWFEEYDISIDKSKEQWIKLMTWWRKTRQYFDPMPVKRWKLFKKRYKKNVLKSSLLLYKQRQKSGIRKWK